jgi:RNA polymerase-binding transcription factor DksA
MPTKTAPASHLNRLKALKQATEERLVALAAAYEELDFDAHDVGASDEEGGGEADGTQVERDRIRIETAEAEAMLLAIEAATERAGASGWDKCSECGKPIGKDRLEALPTTDVCVACKATKLLR